MLLDGDRGNPQIRPEMPGLWPVGPTTDWLPQADLPFLSPLVSLSAKYSLINSVAQGGLCVPQKLMHAG